MPWLGSAPNQWFKSHFAVMHGSQARVIARFGASNVVAARAVAEFAPQGAYSLDGGFEGARSYPESAAVF